MNTSRLHAWLLTVLTIAVSGCQSHEAGSHPLAAVGTTSAVVVGGALSPLGSVLRAVEGPTRHLAEPRFYELAPGRVAVTNAAGWFTDHSEFVPRGNYQSYSAWVLDLRGARGDGTLLLTPDNLVRWFWREHTADQLTPIPRRASPPAPDTDSFDWDAKHRTVNLRYRGQTHRIALIQGHLP